MARAKIQDFLLHEAEPRNQTGVYVAAEIAEIAEKQPIGLILCALRDLCGEISPVFLGEARRTTERSHRWLLSY